MLFGPLLERFTQQTPLTVMARGLLEHALQPSALDALFERTAQVQYTRELLFSTLVETMSLVVCGFYKSPRAVYRHHPERFPVTLKSVYDKLKGVEPAVMQQLVRHSCTRLAPVIDALGGALPDLLPGYRVKILDGNCLAGTEHRVKELQSVAAAPLPGKSLVVLDPALGLAVDVFPCEDGHTQERALLPAVLATIVKGELWIEDRNFCTTGFLCGIDHRWAFFLVREHQGLPWEVVSKPHYVGRSTTGQVWEQTVRLEDDSGNIVFARRVVVQLDKPTRDGDTQVVLLTNVWDESVDAVRLAELYRQRWTIETLFLVLTKALDCEQERLGYPKAALFAFCVALAAYNVLATVKAALRVVHGSAKVEHEVSLFGVVEEIQRHYSGMLVAFPAEEWQVYQDMSPGQLAAWLRQLSQYVQVAKIAKAPARPKKPRTPRHYDPAVPHVSTAKLLAKRKC